MFKAQTAADTAIAAHINSLYTWHAYLQSIHPIFITSYPVLESLPSLIGWEGECFVQVVGSSQSWHIKKSTITQKQKIETTTKKDYWCGI